MFGLFSRKSTLDDTAESPVIIANDTGTRLPTPTPSITSVSHPSPLRFSTTLRTVFGSTGPALKDSDPGTESLIEGGNDANSSAPPPPVTPSPPPIGPNEAKALYDLMLTIPPKTLHAYTLAHLRPLPPPVPPSTSTSPSALGLLPDDAPRPPSPNTAAKLTAFFQTLAPPPLLHCMRCHKDFHEIENEEKDKACRVAHDDESALVTRLPGAAGYETLWSCCGQTASGDGSEGPPDGWCYEGRHTIDIKRARFRADSTIHNDKLPSCLKLNCHGIRDQLPRRDVHTSPAGTLGRSSARRSNPSPARSLASTLAPRSVLKRPRKSLKEASDSDSESDAESVGARNTKDKDKEKVGGGAGEEDKDGSTVVNESRSKPKLKVTSRPISRGRPPRSTSTAISPPKSGSKPPVSTKGRTTPAKPKSLSRTLLSQSHTHLPSDSEGSTRLRPRTRSRVRDESRGRSTSTTRKASALERVRRTKKVTSASEEEPAAETDEHQDSERETRGRERKRRRV